MPIKLDFSSDKILKTKVLRLNLSNFNNLKINYDYFLISHKKSIKDYPKKLRKIITSLKVKSVTLPTMGMTLIIQN